MKIPQFIHTLRKVSEDNAPAILTGVGITGTVVTAYFTGKAAFQAADVIRDAQEQWHEAVAAGEPMESELTLKDKAMLTWKLYLPAAGAGCVTVGCIYFANRISSKRLAALAALAAAYTIAEKANSEYKEKVLEMLGQDKEEKVRASVQHHRRGLIRKKYMAPNVLERKTYATRPRIMRSCAVFDSLHRVIILDHERRD